jgi:Tfp pilus assembly protein PilX
MKIDNFYTASKEQDKSSISSCRIKRQMHQRGPVGKGLFQKGLVTLATSFILLMGITLITLNSSRLGVLELFVSGSYEDRNTAFNNAESGVDVVYANVRNLMDLNKPIGYKNCTTFDDLISTDVNCDANSITSANGWPAEFSNSNHQASVVYDQKSCPPRSLDTSCSHVQFAHYNVDSVFDNTSSKASRSKVVLGLMELVPAF